MYSYCWSRTSRPIDVLGQETSPDPDLEYKLSGNRSGALELKEDVGHQKYKKNECLQNYLEYSFDGIQGVYLLNITSHKMNAVVRILKK